MEPKTYPRQKKEPEMLNDFGPAGGYDCIYPASESGKYNKNNNANLTTDKKELEPDNVGSNGADIISIEKEDKEY
jgi:hypothetical protein